MLLVLEILIFLAILFHLTLPTLFWLDSGEFILASWGLGITHNPGYPIYSTIGKLWLTAIPFGNIAFRLNCLSAVFTILAAYMLMMAVKEAHRSDSSSNRWLPFIPPLYILSPVVLEQSLMAEVYAFHGFLFSLLLWSAMRLKARPNKQGIYLFTFVAFFALANHYSTLLYIPVFIVFLRKEIVRFLTLQTITTCTTLVILAISVFLYLPLRALTDPALNFNDPQTLERFTYHAGAGSHLQKSVPDLLISERLTRFWESFKYLVRQLILPLLVIAITYPPVRRFTVLAFAIIGMNLIYMSFINVVPLEAAAYGFPAIIGLTVLAGVAFTTKSGMHKRNSFRFVLIALVICLALCFNVLSSYHLRSYRQPLSFGKAILTNLAPNAVIGAYSDSVNFIGRYLQVIEGWREDLHLMPRDFPFIHVHRLPETFNQMEYNGAIRSEGLTDLQRFKLLIPKQTSVYWEYRLNEDNAGVLLPVGYLAKVKSDTTRPFIPRASLGHRFYEAQLEDQMGTISQGREQLSMAWNTIGLLNVHNHYDAAAEQAFRQATKANPKAYRPWLNLGTMAYEKGEFRNAQELYEKALTISPQTAEISYHAGLAAIKLGEMDKAVVNLKRALMGDDRIPVAALELARIYYQEGAYDQALDCGLAAWKMGLKTDEVTRLIGRCREKVGE